MINKKTTIISVSSLLIVFLIIIITNQKIQTQTNKLPAKLYFANINISELSQNEAQELIMRKYDEVEAHGLNLEYNNKIINIPSVASSLDMDLAYVIFYFERDSISDTLNDYNNFNNLYRLIRKYLPVKAITIKPRFLVDESRIKEYVLKSFPEIELEPENASFIFIENEINIQKEKRGQKINWDKVLSEIHSRLNYFSSAPIIIYLDIKNPEIYERDLFGLENQADKITKKPLYLKHKNKQWLIKQADIASWLSIEKRNNNFDLSFDQKRIAEYLEKKISPEINIEAKSNRFEIKDNKINNWQPGQKGQSLDTNLSAENIIKNYNIDQVNSSELIVKVTEPEEVGSLNIKDIIGVGHSNFAGSSASRRHNIEIGFAAIHGLIIKPEEEFSLVKALGNIDANAGYLPELVIKGNETIPEYGGGLCQVATTLFRSALASGLPITARKNHSYRVSYYEPAGTDASVYDPWPDVKFINDTDNDILIQAKIEKNDVYLDFWGTKDGRIVEISEPVIYDIVAPPPKKIIETDKLAPGKIKCTENAHNGAKTYFDYTVIYSDVDEESGEKEQKYTRFNSTYVPWQEICLIGKEIEEDPSEDSSNNVNKVDTENNQESENQDNYTVETINET